MAQVQKQTHRFQEWTPQTDAESKWLQQVYQGQALLERHYAVSEAHSTLSDALEIFLALEADGLYPMQTQAFLSEIYLELGEIDLSKQALQKGLRYVGLNLLDIKKCHLPDEMWTHQVALGRHALAHLIWCAAQWSEQTDSTEQAIAILRLIPAHLLPSGRASRQSVRWMSRGRVQWSLARLYARYATECEHWMTRVLWGYKTIGAAVAGVGYFKQSQRDLFPHTIWLVVQLFSHLLQARRRDDLDELHAVLERIHELVPGWTTIQNLLGMIYASVHQDDEASYWFQRSLYRTPRNYDALVGLGVIAKSAGHMSQAEDYFKRALLLQPNQADVMVELAQIEALNQNLESAMITYQSALQWTEDDSLKVDIYKDLAHLYMEADMEQHHDKLVDLYRMIVDLQPHAIENYMELASLYFERQQYHKAEDVFLQGLQISPANAPLLCSLAYVYWMQDNSELSVQTYRKAIEADPEYDVPYNNLGVVYLDNLNDIAQAKPLFEQAIQCNDRYTMAYYNLGRCYQYLGQPVLAAEWYQKAKVHCAFDAELSEEIISQALMDLFRTDAERA